ncbi:hypothetical protein ABZ370_22195 [Streptomyces sp. NPDC005962]|uniref:hypothetical protein n=1 Tax=Streptomyces sp. NPDC005962 TaxID=3154466 RepID=UPI0033EFF591
MVFPPYPAAAAPRAAARVVDGHTVRNIHVPDAAPSPPVRTPPLIVIATAEQRVSGE